MYSFCPTIAAELGESDAKPWTGKDVVRQLCLLRYVEEQLTNNIVVL